MSFIGSFTVTSSSLYLWNIDHFIISCRVIFQELITYMIFLMTKLGQKI